jgi:hypothetical protein
VTDPAQERWEHVDRHIVELIACNSCGRRPSGYTEFATGGWDLAFPADAQGLDDPEEAKRRARGRTVAFCPECADRPAR